MMKNVVYFYRDMYILHILHMYTLYRQCNLPVLRACKLSMGQGLTFVLWAAYTVEAQIPCYIEAGFHA